MFKKSKDEGKVIKTNDDGTYEKQYKDGLVEKVRFTPGGREVHDFYEDGEKKASIWKS